MQINFTYLLLTYVIVILFLYFCISSVKKPLINNDTYEIASDNVTLNSSKMPQLTDHVTYDSPEWPANNESCFASHNSDTHNDTHQDTTNNTKQPEDNNGYNNLELLNGIKSLSNQEPVPFSNQEPVPLTNQEPVPLSNQEPVPWCNQEPVSLETNTYATSIPVCTENDE